MLIVDEMRIDKTDVVDVIGLIDYETAKKIEDYFYSKLYVRLHLLMILIHSDEDKLLRETLLTAHSHIDSRLTMINLMKKISS